MKAFFLTLLLYCTGLFAEELSLKQRQILTRFAPVLFHLIAEDSAKYSWDFPTTIDFDGDSISNNNEESLKKGGLSLEATLYGSLLETGTHYFLTYSQFHPLDWSNWPPIIPYSWHENDMENIQVVVEKGPPEQVVLLAVQAHTKTRFYLRKGIKTASKALKISKSPITLTDTTLITEGTHPMVWVEAGGHGIYGFSPEVSKKVHRPHFTFVPSYSNRPDEFRQGVHIYKYQILSTYSAFWLPYLRSSHIGNGRLFDGSFNYSDELFDLPNLPRHFDSDRYCGPGKYDSGILPFAFSQDLKADDLGVIFFNPAKKFRDILGLPIDNTVGYIYHPYLDDVRQMLVQAGIPDKNKHP